MVDGGQVEKVDVTGSLRDDHTYPAGARRGHGDLDGHRVRTARKIGPASRQLRDRWHVRMTPPPQQLWARGGPRVDRAELAPLRVRSGCRSHQGEQGSAGSTFLVANQAQRARGPATAQLTQQQAPGGSTGHRRIPLPATGPRWRRRDPRRPRITAAHPPRSALPVDAVDDLGGLPRAVSGDLQHGHGGHAHRARNDFPPRQHRSSIEACGYGRICTCRLSLASSSRRGGARGGSRGPRPWLRHG